MTERVTPDMAQYLGTIGGLTKSMMFVGTTIIVLFGNVHLNSNLIKLLYKEHSPLEEASILKNPKEFVNSLQEHNTDNPTLKKLKHTKMVN